MARRFHHEAVRFVTPPGQPPDDGSELARQLNRELSRVHREIAEQAVVLEAEAFAAAEAMSREPDLNLDGPTGRPRQMMLRRADYVSAVEEHAHCQRTASAELSLRLVDAGDRLAIWSPHNGGGLLNPKGRGIRSVGLTTSYLRGSTHYRSAYAWADLRPWRRVLLRREPHNPHDPNAVAVLSTARETIGYVQAGKVRAIARRMDAGERFAAVSMRGPAPGQGDDTTFIVVAEINDIAIMLTSR